MNRSMRFNEQIQSDKKPLNPNLEFWCTLPAPWRPLLPPPSLPPLPAGVWIQHAASLPRKICLVRQQHRRRPSPGLVEPLPFLRIVQPLCSRYWKWVCLSWTWRLWLVAIFTNISIRFFVLSWTLQILVYACWTKINIKIMILKVLTIYNTFKNMFDTLVTRSSKIMVTRFSKIMVRISNIQIGTQKIRIMLEVDRRKQKNFYLYLSIMIFT